MDYERLGLAVAEMLDVGYTPEWISYFMDIFGVPKEYPRPVEGKSKYLFCKDLFRELQKEESTREIIVDIAKYIIESERFDRRLRGEGMKHLPVFKTIIGKAGFKLTSNRVIRINPVFHTREFALDSKLCVVLMPFTPEWAGRVYSKVLKPILLSCELDPKRADDFFGYDVMEDIWMAINTAFIIIADVTGRNANVFYELGIAHTLGKNVIILTQDERDVPFDINRFRYIKYADNKDGYELLEELLPQYVAQFYSLHRFDGA